MTIATLALSAAAGALSTLSPCVLPLLPVVIGTAASEHRWGPVALAAGLATSFATIGLFVATAGFAIGLDSDVFRSLAAVLLLAIGFVLTIPRLQEQFAVIVGPVGTWAGNHLPAVGGSGLSGQFSVGILLGAVWSPCAGPVLGAASVLASQGQRLIEVALTMMLFGIGAAIPLLALGTLSRTAVLQLRGRLHSASAGLRGLMGILLVVVGATILTGQDKRLETWLLIHSPEWLTTLTTSI